MAIERVRLPRARQLVAVVDVADPSEDTALWPTTGEYPIYDAMAYYFMTHDVERVRRYESAIAHLAHGRTAVDIGTGQDVNWAHRCVTEGATKVFAIEEMDDTLAKASAYVRAHALESRIALLRGNSREVQLPERVDLCVSEIIGTIGSSEGVIASLLDAHRRFLKPGGAMIPFRCVTRVAATTLPDPLARTPAFARDAIDYIDEVFAAAGTTFDLRIAVENYARSLVLSDAADYEDLRFDNAAALTEAMAPTSREVELTITTPGALVGLVLWIQLWTEPGDDVLDVLASDETTSTFSPVLFPLFWPGVEVAVGDRLAVRCERTMSDDGIHPDYAVSGALTTRSGVSLPFTLRQPHHGPGFRQNAMYRQLFPSDEAV